MKRREKKYHYVYELCVDEPNLYAMLNAELPVLYFGLRSCDCLPEEDVNYWSSSEYVKAAIEAGVPFFKVIVATYKTRAEAAAHERRELHSLKYDDTRSDEDKRLFQRVADLIGRPYQPRTSWGSYLNKVVPGEFGVIDYVNRAVAVKRNVERKKPVFKRSYVEAHPVENRRGGPGKGYVQSAVHQANVKKSISSYWSDLKAFAAYHGIKIQGKGASNINRDHFRAWRDTLVSAPLAVQSGGNEGFYGINSSLKTALAEPA